jgi:hypothetical protein
LAVADGGGLDRALLALAADEGGPSGASGLRPTDLGSGAVDAQHDVSGLGAGEHVGQGAEAQAWSLRDGEPRSASSSLISPIARPIVEDPDLADHAEGLVGQTCAQAAQGDQQSAGEHQRDRPQKAEWDMAARA